MHVIWQTSACQRVKGRRLRAIAILQPDAPRWKFTRPDTKAQTYDVTYIGVSSRQKPAIASNKYKRQIYKHELPTSFCVLALVRALAPVRAKLPQSSFPRWGYMV